MEVKRPASQTAEQSAKKVSKFRNFITDVKAEITRIHWTSKNELIAYTKIVMGTAFAFGFGVYFIDLIIQGVLSGLSSLVRMISG